MKSRCDCDKYRRRGIMQAVRRRAQLSHTAGSVWAVSANSATSKYARFFSYRRGAEQNITIKAASSEGGILGAQAAKRAFLYGAQRLGQEVRGSKTYAPWRPDETVLHVRILVGLGYYASLRILLAIYHFPSERPTGVGNRLE